MNHEDVLMDCAMGIYMDADVGPQTWGVEKAADDLSGYVKGEGYEFAFTRDADGMVAYYRIGGCPRLYARPGETEIPLLYWKVGTGPDDFNPRSLSTSKATANENTGCLPAKIPIHHITLLTSLNRMM